jgi:hypothetical protein
MDRGSDKGGKVIVKETQWCRKRKEIVLEGGKGIRLSA